MNFICMPVLHALMRDKSTGDVKITAMRKVGLLFGSFNPVHNGHVRFVESTLVKTDCDEVWLAVQASNPYKQQDALAPLSDRVKMCELAFSGVKNVKIVSTDRVHLAKTIQDLQQKDTQNEFVILLGQDVAVSFPAWPDYRQIVENFTVYYHPRPGFRLPKSEHLIAIEADELDVSSTQIRQLIVQKAEALPKKVYDYIKSNRLYGHDGSIDTSS